MVLLRVAGELFFNVPFLFPFVCFLLTRKNRPPILYFFGAFNSTLAGFLSFCFACRLPHTRSLLHVLFLLLFYFILVHPVFFCVCLFLIVVCLLLTTHVSHRPTVTSLSFSLPLSLSLMDIACILPTNYAYDSNLPPIVLFSLSPRPPQLLFYLDRANSPKKSECVFLLCIKIDNEINRCMKKQTGWRKRFEFM
jgi:hypothetical protein